MARSRAWVIVILVGMATLACSSLGSLRPPSMMTLEAREAGTATVGAVTDLLLKGAPVIASPSTTASRLNDSTQFLEGYASEQYSAEELSQAGQSYQYTIRLAGDDEALWGTNWCTTTKELLEDNWANIELEFSVNDSPVPLTQFTVVETESDGLVCRYYFTLLYQWQPGETNLLIKVTFAKELDDGMSVYPAGSHFYRYQVTVP